MACRNPYSLVLSVSGLVNNEGAIDRYVRQLLQCAIGLFDREAINPVSATDPGGDRQRDLGQIAARRHHLAALCDTTCLQLNPGADCIRIVSTAYQLRPQTVVTESLVVAKQQRLNTDLGPDHIQVAIPVNIGVRSPTPNDGAGEISCAVCFYRHKGHFTLGASIPE